MGIEPERPAGRKDSPSQGLSDFSAADLGDRNGHGRCMLRGGLQPRSWRLPFEAVADDRIRAEFVASEDMQGYDGLLHGGVIAALMDVAIIHWLFQHDIQAVTGDLRVRYLQPVACNIPLELIAWQIFSCPPL
ncbi:MAG: PaaI family thioesterase, partial [Desulfobulbus sp.]|nr:PaaI family thioesterase [Desulfobulbus sp.]